MNRGLHPIPTVVCLLLLAACGTSGATTTTTAASPGLSASPTPSATASQACQPTQITITLTHSGAVMGESGGFLTFTNIGHTDCSLTGWPGVTGSTASGTTVTSDHPTSMMFAIETVPSPPPVVDVAPGQSAYAAAAGGNTPQNGATTCPYVTRLHVSLPGSTTVTTLSARLPSDGSYLPVCPGDNGKLNIGVSDIVPLSDLAH